MNYRDETIRNGLYQFIGGLIAISPNIEEVIAIILEEVVRLAREDPEDEKSPLDKDLVRPILKSAKYVLAMDHNKLKIDAEQTFGARIPESVLASLEEKKQLIEMLDKNLK